jgi:hypothetical protein
MKKKRTKKISIPEELLQLQARYMAGNIDAWTFAEYHIDTIDGLDYEEELFLKTRMKQYLGVDNQK